MQDNISPKMDLNTEELEAALKALGLFQIHLFDEMSNENEVDREKVQIEIRNTTSCIKKLHKILEAKTK